MTPLTPTTDYQYVTAVFTHTNGRTNGRTNAHTNGRTSRSNELQRKIFLENNSWQPRIVEMNFFILLLISF